MKLNMEPKYRVRRAVGAVLGATVIWKAMVLMLKLYNLFYVFMAIVIGEMQ